MRPVMVPTMEMRRVMPVPRRNCFQFLVRMVITCWKKLGSAPSVLLSAGWISIILSMRATRSFSEMVSRTALTLTNESMSSFLKPTAMAASDSATSKPGFGVTMRNLELALSAVRASGRSEM